MGIYGVQYYMNKEKPIWSWFLPAIYHFLGFCCGGPGPAMSLCFNCSLGHCGILRYFHGLSLDTTRGCGWRKTSIVFQADVKLLHDGVILHIEWSRQRKEIAEVRNDKTLTYQNLTGRPTR